MTTKGRRPMTGREQRAMTGRERRATTVKGRRAMTITKTKRYSRSTSQHSLQDQLLHVRRAFIDLAHSDIAIDPLYRVVGEEPVPAQRLDRGGADRLGGFGREQLGHAGGFQ